MLTEKNQNLSFDQFLFLHFDLKKQDGSELQKEHLVHCGCATSCGCKTSQDEIEEQVAEPKKAEVEKTVKTKVETIIKCNVSEVPKAKSLTDVIDSIPDRVRSMDIEELSHKHESEWYHAFRDLKEDIVHEVSQKHPHHHGHLKLKTDIKHFTEQFDDQVDKVMLEVERIFQAYPNMSRVAVIYLLSIVISVPLFFLSGANPEKTARQIDVSIKTAITHTKQIILDSETKSRFIRENSQEILATGDSVYKVTEGTASVGQVAGAYTEASDEDTKLNTHVSSWYRQIDDLKNEFDYFIKKNFGK